MISHRLIFHVCVHLLHVHDGEDGFGPPVTTNRTGNPEEAPWLQSPSSN